MLRVVGCPPPCEKCPKESPEKEHEHVLSEKNWATFDFYCACKATSGACFLEHMAQDETLLENLAIIERIMKSFDSYQLQSALLSTPRL